MRRWIDALLLLMALIWGSNFAIIKTAFKELEPQSFNAMRMIVASLAFLAVIAAGRAHARRHPAGDTATGSIASIFYTAARITGREWLALGALGFVGHVLYQFLFIGGVALTSVANSALLLAIAPVLIALVSAAIGQERVSGIHWLGACVSLFGIYLVVGQGFELGGGNLRGDLMMFGAVCCWAAYTLGSRPLVARHSPVAITGISMALGTLIYVPLLWGRLTRVNWLEVSGWTMFLLVYSALFALCVAYTIWYVGVRQIGSARTSAYSNFIPIVAMASAVIFLGEPVGLRKVLGAVSVLAGVALTRAGGTKEAAPPPEE